MKRAKRSSSLRDHAASIRRRCRRTSITPAQIAAHSVALPRREPPSSTCTHAIRTGSRSTPERFLEFLPQIKRQTDAIINITTEVDWG